MKRKGNLYEGIITYENLQLADQRARKGKRGHYDIKNFDKKKEENLLRLQKELEDETYCTSAYSHFTISEPKKREISKLPYKDRVVHHAILNYAGDIFTSCFISQTYSCIKGRGIHKCLFDLNKALVDEPSTRYCLKLDIRKFYPSVDNNILKKQLRTKFKDGRLLGLMDNIIDSTKGIPLGNYTSQWFDNFYLNQFDHWLKETKGIRHYFRYCDDLVILLDNKEELHALRLEIQDYLRTNLNLELSNYQVFPVAARGIDFLGYKSYHTHILLRKSIKNRMRRMIMKYPNGLSFNSYLGWCKWCNSINLVNDFTGHYKQHAA